MPAAREPLRIGYLSTFYHTSPLLMAKAVPGAPEGARWELFPTGPAMMEAFAAGRLDVGYVGLTPAMVGIARGTPVRCVAGGHMEGTVIIGLPKLQPLGAAGGEVVEVLRQFRGAAVGTPTRGSIHDVILRDLLRRGGLEDEVEVRNYPQADLIVEALAAGELAGGAGTPALAVAAARFAGARVLVPPHRLWPHNPSYGIVARRELAEGEPALLEAFLRAHEAATGLIRRESRRAAVATARLVGLVDEAFVLETYRLSPRYCAALPREFVEATMAFVPVLRQLGYLPRPLGEAEVFDRRFIERVHPEPPHYGEGLGPA